MRNHAEFRRPYCWPARPNDAPKKVGFLPHQGLESTPSRHPVGPSTPVVTSVLFGCASLVVVVQHRNFDSTIVSRVLGH